jgi:hypothetical protein
MSDLSIVNINLILAVLLVIDFLWLLHRIARTFNCSKQILYGYPVEFDCRGKLGKKYLPICHFTDWHHLHRRYKWNFQSIPGKVNNVESTRYLRRKPTFHPRSIPPNAVL